jgi:hypothetical protein
MVGMVMRQQDRDQPVTASRQMLQHRRGIAWIDHGGASIAAQQPDIVVAKGRQGKHFNHPAILS